MAGDSLFSYIETLQGDRPWGRVLDAGLGDHSLNWIRSLTTDGWTGVTVDDFRMLNLVPKIEKTMRDADSLVLGDWRDENLLEGEQFDVVLVDYLIGAIDAFTPYFQNDILKRLHRHVRGCMYLVGLTPFPDKAEKTAHQKIIELARLKDALRLLTGKRAYREYPLEWVMKRLDEAGFEVTAHQIFPIVMRRRYFERQLRSCRQLVKDLNDTLMAEVFRQHIQQLESDLFALSGLSNGIHFGSDYVIAATPKK